MNPLHHLDALSSLPAARVSAALRILSVYTPAWAAIGMHLPYFDKWKHFAGSLILVLLFRLAWPKFPAWKALLL